MIYSKFQYINMLKVLHSCSQTQSIDKFQCLSYKIFWLICYLFTSMVIHGKVSDCFSRSSDIFHQFFHSFISYKLTTIEKLAFFIVKKTYLLKPTYKVWSFFNWEIAFVPTFLIPSSVNCDDNLKWIAKLLRFWSCCPIWVVRYSKPWFVICEEPRWRANCLRALNFLFK